MKGKTYRVHLKEGEEKRLRDITRNGKHPARQIVRAHILLLLNEEQTQEGTWLPAPESEAIAQQCHCGPGLVYTVGKQYAEEGIERVLNRKKRETPPVPPKVTGEVEAKLIALCCGKAPEGRSRWTLRLLEERSEVELGVHLSDSTIGNLLKKRP